MEHTSAPTYQDAPPWWSEGDTYKPFIISNFQSIWTVKSAKQEQDLSTLVAEKSSIETATKVLERAEIQGGRVPDTNDEVQVAIRTIKTSSSRIDDLLRAMLAPKHFNALHSTTSPMTASQFFDIAELTELVCASLGLLDLLALRQVNQRLRAIIDGTPALQVRTRTLPYVTGDTARLCMDLHVDSQVVEKLKLPRIEVYYHPGGFGARPDGNIDIVFTLNAAGEPETEYITKPSEIVRRILILVPSLTKMEVWSRCCMKPAPVENEAGFTIGDICDAREKTREAHRLCPFAPSMLNQLDGTVAPDIRLYASLPEDLASACKAYLDAVAAEEQQRKRKATDAAERERKRQDLIAAYCEAKMDAHDA